MNPYFWFPPEVAARVARLIAAAGKDGARLEFRVDGDDEKASAYVRVRPLTGEAREAMAAAEGEDCDEWINNSHRCPPEC